MTLLGHAGGSTVVVTRIFFFNSYRGTGVVIQVPPPQLPSKRDFGPHNVCHKALRALMA